VDSCKVGKDLRERLLKEFPFPIQRVQTDRGSESVVLDFQDALREQHIKFRPNRPWKSSS
jgi:hypothetical protein